MWQSRTKDDLIIEVWEKLDCENVGAVEIEAIEVAVEEHLGRGAVDSPMIIARLLADEGAELRHSEIMELFVKRHAKSPYEAMFYNILKLADLGEALGTIRNLENLRKKLSSENDKEGLRLLRDTALHGKKNALEMSADLRRDEATRLKNTEIAEWMTIWLQSPEIFENWITLRRSSADFKDKFESALSSPDSDGDE
jgi:hypothetical protein